MAASENHVSAQSGLMVKLKGSLHCGGPSQALHTHHCIQVTLEQHRVELHGSTYI